MDEVETTDAVTTIETPAAKAAKAAAEARAKRVRALVAEIGKIDELTRERDVAKAEQTALVEHHKVAVIQQKEDAKTAAKRVHLAQQALMPAAQALDELRVLSDPDRSLKRAVSEARVRATTLEQELVDARLRMISQKSAIDALAKDTNDPATLDEYRKDLSRITTEVRDLEKNLASANEARAAAEAAREKALVDLVEAHRPKARAAK